MSDHASAQNPSDPVSEDEGDYIEADPNGDPGAVASDDDVTAQDDTVTNPWAHVERAADTLPAADKPPAPEHSHWHLRAPPASAARTAAVVLAAAVLFFVFSVPAHKPAGQTGTSVRRWSGELQYDIYPGPFYCTQGTERSALRLARHAVNSQHVREHSMWWSWIAAGTSGIPCHAVYKAHDGAVTVCTRNDTQAPVKCTTVSAKGEVDVLAPAAERICTAEAEAVLRPYQ